MMGRIAPPKGLEDDLEKLVSVDPQGKHPLFETKQKALMFAAALGHWRAGARRTVDKKGIGIRPHRRHAQRRNLTPKSLRWYMGTSCEKLITL